MTRYVALYCRISVDRSGRREGVDAQERWGRTYAASTWPDLPVRVFVDNDLSAANGDTRPGFDELRRAVTAGDVAHLWVVEQSRLERTEVGWFELAAALDAAGIDEVHTRRDGIVRVRDDVAGIKAVINAGEVRRLKRRVLDRLADNAAHGRPSGGRIFGYRSAVDEYGDKTLAVVPAEADAIRYAADRVLSGWSLEAVARELRARGLRGARGGELTLATVKRMVTTPTVAGLRVHRGEIRGKGNWPPIIDRTTYEDARAKLAPASRGRARRRYLLTGGLAVCGVCGHPLAGMVKRWRDRAVPMYVCHPTRGGRGCVGVMAEPTEAHVVAVLFDELDKPEFLDAIAADDHAARREELVAAVDDLDRQRRALAVMWAAGDRTDAEWDAARSVLDNRGRALRVDLDAVPPPTVGVDIAEARSSWPAMTLDERGEFVRLFVERVTVNRATPGARKFDPARVGIEWRTA